jgi:hypothetical protein
LSGPARAPSAPAGDDPGARATALGLGTSPPPPDDVEAETAPLRAALASEIFGASRRAARTGDSAFRTVSKRSASRLNREELQFDSVAPTRWLSDDTQQKRERNQEAKTQGSRAKSKLNSTAVVKAISCKPPSGMLPMIPAIARDGGGNGQRNCYSRPYQATEHHAAVQSPQTNHRKPIAAPNYGLTHSIKTRRLYPPIRFVSARATRTHNTEDSLSYKCSDYGLRRSDQGVAGLSADFPAIDGRLKRVDERVWAHT